MSKGTVSALGLAEKYLASLGISKTTLNSVLLPSKYIDEYMCASQAKSNIVLSNKKGLGSHETHIAPPTSAFPVFFTAAQILAYATTKNSNETDQKFNIFEANVQAMLERRTKRASKSHLIEYANQIGTYTLKTNNLLTGTGRKWIRENNGQTQVRLGKVNYDSSLFKDFRLGILKDDFLLFFKEKHSDVVLAISIPSEYAHRYTIKNKKAFLPSTPKIRQQKEIETSTDALYVSSSLDRTIPISYSPKTPQPAPHPGPNKPGKPRYKANASLGKGALAKAKYTCENCGHGTFKAQSTGNDFMEPHHLIPISRQGDFTYSIDITSNLICLCPNCHSQIHYGQKSDIEKMLKKFLAIRKTDLKSDGGIDIDENTLLSYYNI